MAERNVATDELQPGEVAVLGIPYDGGASFISGQAQSPSRIRESLYSDSTNLCTESGIDLGTDSRWRDLGDMEISSAETAFMEIEKKVALILSRNARVAALGGDHSITYPILRAYAGKYKDLNVLHLDAHPDLYDELGGNRHSHACPFARIMEEDLAARLVQVGIRTMTTHQREQAEKFGVEVIEMRDWDSLSEIELGESIYLSVDMDVLDPAYAPGVSHHEPGGMTSRDVIRIIQGLKGDIVGADIVEYTPERDVVGMTAMVAAKLAKEIVARMMEQNR
jgi:agmatinase